MVEDTIFGQVNQIFFECFKGKLNKADTKNFENINLRRILFNIWTKAVN